MLRIVKVAKKWEPRRRKLIINITFKVLPALTDRTVAVAEAFGMGVDREQVFPVYKSFCLELGLDDVIYITGPSGSGKSVLLHALKDALGPLAADMADVEVRHGVPIIDTIGKDVEEAIRLLTAVGLSDAITWLRTYDELSDGQKYRYRLAKLLEGGSRVWVCDEFCSTLDRDTAKVVAFNIQRLARKLKRGLIVATAHSDLFNDLRPSIYIVKGLGPDVSIHYYPNKPSGECSIAREITFCLASSDQERSEALRLVERWHYRGRRPPFKHVFVAKRGNRVVGAVLLSPPYVSCWGRSLLFKRVPGLRELNRWLYTASRVVLHPMYRGIGLGSRLLRAALMASDRPYVELVAVMARYNPFAEKAGMVKVGVKGPDPGLEEAVKALRALGLDDRLMASERYNMQFLSSLPEGGIRAVKEALSKLRNLGLFRSMPALRSMGYPSVGAWEEAVKRASLRELARLLATLASIRARKVYLIWRDPRLAPGRCPLDELLRPKWRELLLGGGLGHEQGEGPRS